LASAGGEVANQLVDHYSRIAKGGVGLIIIERALSIFMRFIVRGLLFDLLDYYGFDRTSLGKLLNATVFVLRENSDRSPFSVLVQQLCQSLRVSGTSSSCYATVNAQVSVDNNSILCHINLIIKTGI